MPDSKALPANRMLHDTLVITAITLVAGLILSLVHGITLEPIRRQEALKKELARKAVFADAVSFGSLLEEKSADLEAWLDENGFPKQNVDEAAIALDAEGAPLGYVLTVTTREGYGGDIQFAMGVRDDGTMNGISILSISETAGLGMRANTDAFRSQFAGRNVSAFRYTKSGAQAEDEIDALSGATVTTNAMTNGVNAGLAAFRWLKENPPMETTAGGEDE